MLGLEDRSFAIQKMFALHDEQKYKKETIFTAVSIFDRYLSAIGYQTYPQDQVLLLAVVSLLLAAKIHEPIATNFNSMIGLLSKKEKKKVNSKSLMKHEIEVLTELGFDLCTPGPLPSLERYLRLLDYHKEDEIIKMSFTICKLLLVDSSFLNYRPSQLAACTAIIAVNIFMHDK